MKKIAFATASLALVLSATAANTRAIETIPGNLDTGTARISSIWNFFFG
ncbi:hypothetical protein [Novosphingobium guangzhouense]|nr:hypothetical protein [Novosphingobium guangzhouense]